MSEIAWKPISSAPRDGSYVIVGYDIASVWIVRSAFYNYGEVAKRLAELNNRTINYDDIGWWSYENSVSQVKLCFDHEPTHWLCVVPEEPN